MVSGPSSTFPKMPNSPIQNPSCSPPFRSDLYSTIMLTLFPSTVGVVLVASGPGVIRSVNFRAASGLSAVPSPITAFVIVRVCPATMLARSAFPLSVITNP